MGHLPLPASGQVPASLSSLPGARVPHLEPVALIDSLRAKLSARTCPPDALYRAITDGARALTGAEGVALALHTNGLFLCRARSGNLAPEIGAQLNARSGISGECLRTSRSLRCDDTQTDDRVDPEVCRSLGIRSLAVVPLRGRDGTVGVLEAFSARSYAFGAEQVSFLKRLAEVAQSTYEAECRPTESSPELPPEPPSYSRIRRELFIPSASPVPPSALTSNSQPLGADLFGRQAPSTRRYWIAGGAVLLILTAAVVWTTWHEPDEDGPSTQQVTQPQNVSDEPVAHSGPNVIPWKPPAGQPRVRIDQLRSNQIQSDRPQSKSAAGIRLQSVAEIESDKRVQDTADAGPGQVVVQESAGSPQRSPDPRSAMVDSPPVAAPPASTEGLGNLASAPTTLPASDLRVSQGVSEATPARRVEPLYPAEARSQRMGGSVVLEMTIEADGSTRDLKVVSGPSLLARAATDAIRQWRYHPALLNGRPVAVQKQITVIFRAP